MTNHEIEYAERLAKLEVQMEALKGVPAQLDDLNLRLSKYDARWGMLLMIGTALWALFAAFKDNIMHLIKG